MLEEVVRQLSQDLSMAEKAVGRGQAQPDADAALKALPAAEREVKALSTRVSSCRYFVLFPRFAYFPSFTTSIEYIAPPVQQVCGPITVHHCWPAMMPFRL